MPITITIYPEGHNTPSSPRIDIQCTPDAVAALDSLSGKDPPERGSSVSEGGNRSSIEWRGLASSAKDLVEGLYKRFARFLPFLYWFGSFWF